MSIAVIDMPDAQIREKPYQPYAIRFHKEDEVRGFSLLLDHVQEMAGMAGRIFVVYQKDLQVIDKAGVRYDRFEMRGRHTPEEILSYWDAQSRVE